jgi:transcriptional regulator with XRE-family HTH domain
MKQPELGRKIAELRKAKGLTQEELVEKCNLNVRTLQRIESGEVTPRNYTIKSIFAALDYDFSRSSEIATGNFERINFTFFPRLEQFITYLHDLFNLKTNTMKKISILSFLLILIVSITFGLTAFSNKSNPLIGTWKLVATSPEATTINGSIHEGPNVKVAEPFTRILEFKSDQSFESRTVHNTLFNRGIFALLNDQSFVTVHCGVTGDLSAISNLYKFEITNDTLHFAGFYLRPANGQEQYCEKIIVNEWWVRVKDTNK